MKTKCITLLLALLLVFGLTGCGAPDVPMEATIDGNTIVLGQTTMQDLIDLGYEPHLQSRQDVARDGDAYITFYYSLDKGAGHQFWADVAVPWSGDTNINDEAALSTTEGIVRSVKFSKSSTEKIKASYNGIDIQDMTFDYGIEKWGAKKDDRTTVPAYLATVKRGSLRMESESTLEEEFHELTVSLSMKELEKMQK